MPQSVRSSSALRWASPGQRQEIPKVVTVHAVFIACQNQGVRACRSSSRTGPSAVNHPMRQLGCAAHHHRPKSFSPGSGRTRPPL
jgi:hypothetical protein